MRYIGPITPGKIAAAVTLAVVLVVSVSSGGSMFSPGQLNAQGRGSGKHGGVLSHAEIGNNCAACHAPPWSGETMASRCVVCHTDIGEQIEAHAPLHGSMTNVQQCRQCHSEHKGAQAALTNMAHFDHDCAAFKLTGKHQAVECQACHVNSTFKGTRGECISCHEEPKVHKGSFGTVCAQCHSTSTWGGANQKGGFNHDRTAFKLTGKHQTVDCKSCHVNNTFKGTAKDCVSCHAEPTVHKGSFGTACAKCHSTDTWKGVVMAKDFDHEKTAFKLTGKHQMVDCKACHIDNTFKGTSKDCLSCHAEPKEHKGRFGTGCASCHSTETWKGAAFKHKFPLTHGKRKAAIECATCHTTPNEFKTYTCYGCHEHEEKRMERKHKKVTDLKNCARCHPTGREHERERGQIEGPRFEYCRGCPEKSDLLALLAPEREESLRCPRSADRYLEESLLRFSLRDDRKNIPEPVLLVPPMRSRQPERFGFRADTPLDLGSLVLTSFAGRLPEGRFERK